MFYPDPHRLCGPAKPNVASPPDGTFGAKESCGKTLEGGAGGVDVPRYGKGEPWIRSGLGLYEVVPSGLDYCPSLFRVFLLQISKEQEMGQEMALGALRIWTMNLGQFGTFSLKENGSHFNLWYSARLSFSSSTFFFLPLARPLNMLTKC